MIMPWAFFYSILTYLINSNGEIVVDRLLYFLALSKDTLTCRVIKPVMPRFLYCCLTKGITFYSLILHYSDLFSSTFLTQWQLSSITVKKKVTNLCHVTTTLHCLKNVTEYLLCQIISSKFQEQSNNARMNWLPFKALYNCQRNTRMRDCQASTLRLPLSFQCEYIITLRHLSFCRFVMYFSSSHVSSQRVSQCGPTLCYADPSYHLFLFLVLIQALVSILTSCTLSQKTQENPFVMSLTVQFIMDSMPKHYKSTTTAIALKGQLFRGFWENQFQNIINLQGEMFCVVW